MKKQPPQGMEITSFRLAGYTCKQFIMANAGIDEWLSRQPGFQLRTIAEQADGTITDILLWRSVADGTSAMQRIMVEMAHSPVHAMIKQSTVSWNCIPVRHRFNAIKSKLYKRRHL